MYWDFIRDSFVLEDGRLGRVFRRQRFCALGEGRDEGGAIGGLRDTTYPLGGIFTLAFAAGTGGCAWVPPKRLAMKLFLLLGLNRASAL